MLDCRGGQLSLDPDRGPEDQTWESGIELTILGCTFFRNFASYDAALFGIDVWPLVAVITDTDFIENDAIFMAHTHFGWLPPVRTDRFPCELRSPNLLTCCACRRAPKCGPAFPRSQLRTPTTTADSAVPEFSAFVARLICALMEMARKNLTPDGSGTIRAVRGKTMQDGGLQSLWLPR